MKNFLFLILIVIPPVTYSQAVRKVLDNNTHLPVAYATIKVLNKPKGVITSEKGEFELSIDKSDSILVSSVGYYQTILTGDKIGTAIYLAPKIKNLTNVTVSTRKIIRRLLLGSKINLNKETTNWGPGSSNIKEEFAQRIELPDSSYTYKIRQIYIPVRNFRCWGPLLIHIYAPDTLSEFPGEELFIKYVNVQKKDIQQKQILINLGNETLYLTGYSYFFISIGWPEDAYYNNCITTIIMSRLSVEKTYSRQLTGIHYKWFSFGQFRDLNENPFQAKTVYSVELDELK